MMDGIEFFEATMSEVEAMAEKDLRDGKFTLIGGYVVDPMGRVFAQRRSLTRRFGPGKWDNVGGHVENGETLIQALTREMKEETGWDLEEILICFGRRFWDDQRGESVEYLVICTAVGNLMVPILEQEKVDRFMWVTSDHIDSMLENRGLNDRALQKQIFESIFKSIYRLHSATTLALTPNG